MKKHEIGMAWAVLGLLLASGGLRADYKENATGTGTGVNNPASVPSVQNPSSQGGSALTETPLGTQESMEQQVLTEIHNANQMEISLGQLAQQKGRSSAVKSFGEMLVTDHEQADTQVTNLASTQSIPLPQGETEVAAATPEKEKLQNLSGTPFDTAFLKEIKKAHDQNIAKLESAQKELPVSSSVYGLVSQLLPKLKEHRDRASELLRTVSSKSY